MVFYGPSFGLSILVAPAHAAVDIYVCVSFGVYVLGPYDSGRACLRLYVERVMDL